VFFSFLIQLGKVQELKDELINAKRERKDAKKLNVLKKIIANSTMGNDMSPVFRDVLDFLNTDNIEIKRMVLLYLVFYAKKDTDLTLVAVQHLIKVLEFYTNYSL